MILLLLAVLIFCALAAVSLVPLKQRLVLLCLCVALLVIINFFNEIQAGR
jgi:hypothetical protein